MPVDWSALDRSAPLVKEFFSESIKYGVGRQGMTIPIRGANGERAFFSFTLDVDESEWDKFKKINMSLMQVVAHYYHSRVLVTHDISFLKIALTPRQCEVLRWAANGKSVRDTADIMHLSHHTVQTYLESARSRLHALNTVHAVARAIQMNLIFSPE